MKALSEGVYSGGTHGNLYVRRRIPAAIRAAYPQHQTHVIRSLGTSDYRTAKPLAHAELAKIAAEFELKRQKIDLSRASRAVKCVRSRTSGESFGTPLNRINWGNNYDLVVIDESHNFRNNDAYKDKGTRYQKLMNKVIREGVKTKVLMLSATPVNRAWACIVWRAPSLPPECIPDNPHDHERRISNPIAESHLVGGIDELGELRNRRRHARRIAGLRFP